jgi:hypothetical protein
MSNEQKSLCYSLASESFAYVPACETEKSCYEKVDALFKTKFNSIQESNLYEIKNYVGRSWFFYNKAIKNTKELKSLCSEGNASELSSKINQTTDYLDTAFIELELAMKKSFEFINAEEKILTEQDTDLTKEEPIYDSLVELRQIISELKTGGTNSDSYVSFYTKKAESFAKSSASKGYSHLIEKDSFYIEGYSIVENSLLENLGLGGEVLFPTLRGSLEKAMNYAENYFFVRQDLLALERFPSYEYTKLFSDLGGEKNSALKRFIDLVNKTSNNKEQLKERIVSLTNTQKSLLSDCEEGEVSLEKNEKYSKLANELVGTGIETTSAKNITLQSIKAKLILLKERKNKGELTLGKELIELKQINNDLELIKNEIEIKVDYYENKLSKGCEKLAVDSKREQTYNNPQVNEIIFTVNYLSGKIISSPMPIKFAYCEELVEKNKELSLAIENFEELEYVKKQSAKECVLFLEKTLPLTDFYEEKKDFGKLIKMELTKENLFSFFESCENIKKRTQTLLREDATIREIEKNFRKMLENYFEVENIEVYIKSNEKSTNLKKKMEEYYSYFTQDKKKVLFEKVLLIKEKLLESLLSTNKEVEGWIVGEIIQYGTKNTTVKFVNENVLEVNKPYLGTALIQTPNPFREVNQKFYLDFNFGFGKILKADDCVEGIMDLGTKKRIVFNCLPYGGIDIKLELPMTFTTKEEDLIVSASSLDGLIKRKINVNTDYVLSRIYLETNSPLELNGAVVLTNNNEISSNFSKNKISFTTDDVSPSTPITVLFYTKEVIKLNKIENSISSGEYLQTIKQTFVAKNKLPKKLSATLLFDYQNNPIVEKVVLEEEENKVTTKIINNKIIAENQQFNENEEKKYYLTLFVSNVSEYYLEILKEQLVKLKELGMSLEEYKTKLILETTNVSQAALALRVEENINAISAKDEETKKQMQRNLSIKRFEEEYDLQTKKIQQFIELGLIEQAKALENELIKAQTEFENNKDPLKAYEIISKISFNSNEALLKEIEKMSKEIQKIKPNKEDVKLNELITEFSENKSFIETNIYFKPEEVFNRFKDLQSLFNRIISLDINNKISSQEKEAVNKNIIDNLFSTLNKELNDLSNELSDTEQILSEANLFPPITKSRIETIKLELIQIKSSGESDELKINKLNNYLEEVRSAVDFLKQKAIFYFNKGIESGFSKSTLLEAKSKIDTNKYASAFVLLFNASIAKKEDFGYLGFIPIVLIVLVAIVLKLTIGKKDKQKEDQKKIVEDNWKE